MSNKSNQIEYHKDRETYIPHNPNKKDPVFKRLKQARMMLFISSIIHLGAAVVFLILLIIGLIAGNNAVTGLTKNQLIMALAYIGPVILIDVLAFLLPSQKARKKSHFRVIAILTLILATLILSGSFVFWGIPTLLFYSLITLIVWICQVVAAVFLILVVEALPN
ncbi:MAG: hypothetical protein REH79_01680 [Spiroplasma sp.]|nr:hypothetical protein [Spiroplasma sp.]